MGTNEVMHFEVAPYALPSILLALYNESVKNIVVTKSDGNIEISISISDLKASVYGHKLEVPEMDINSLERLKRTLPSDFSTSVSDSSFDRLRQIDPLRRDK